MKIAGVALTLVAAVAAALWFLRPTEATVALAQYGRASCVSPKQDGGRRYWNSTLSLPGGASVKVTAEDQTGGLAYVEFSDGTTRHITTLRDYVYPHDLRIARESMTLWILNSGLGGGIFREAHLYEYNLVSRVLVRDLDVDPDDLPDACQVPGADLAPNR
jgi:hypothetical protein